ncbi:MAG TPA: class I lanthipeptide [Haliangiales bacterium]|nr:class I lanthipeptide [Haliangiales bacterium]
MKTTKQKKLRVARETIRVLQDRQLGAVAGGNSALGGYCYRTDATVVNCCPTTH